MITSDESFVNSGLPWDIELKTPQNEQKADSYSMPQG